MRGSGWAPFNAPIPMIHDKHAGGFYSVPSAVADGTESQTPRCPIGGSARLALSGGHPLHLPAVLLTSTLVKKSVANPRLIVQTLPHHLHLGG